MSKDFASNAKKRLLQMHYESGVGHIGGNLSSLDALLVLFSTHISKDDLFILSKGHSAGALYIALWSKGLLTDDDLKRFHKDATRLPGHPPASGISEVRFATGSLGHGLSLAAGSGLARRLKKDGGHVYCLTSDGEWQEGSTWEALIFICHHQLSNVTVLIDKNNLQGFGDTESVASMENLIEKIRAFNVDIVSVPGHDIDAINSALSSARSRPKVIVLETQKGAGVSFMENKMEWHYLPLNQDQYRQALTDLDSAL